MEKWESEEKEQAPVEGAAVGPEAGPVPADGDDPAQEGESGHPEHKEASDGRDFYLNIRVLVVMMSIFVLMFTFVARIIVVSGPSMESTLINGDLMLVWSLGYTPEHGDVVVLTQESYQRDSIVKRVIAMEGQQVDIDYTTGTVYVDGKALEEDYINEEMLLPSYGEGINHVTVPEGCIFVMGDNRNHSADSRYPAIGIVDVRCVIGKGIAVIFPFHHWKGL